MINVILVAALVLIAGGAAMYLYKAKKRGEICIGCPYAKQCSDKSCSCDSPETPTPKQ